MAIRMKQDPTNLGWTHAIAGARPADAPNYIRQDPVLWDLYLYGYNMAKETLS